MQRRSTVLSYGKMKNWPPTSPRLGLSVPHLPCRLVCPVTGYCTRRLETNLYCDNRGQSILDADRCAKKVCLPGSTGSDQQSTFFTLLTYPRNLLHLCQILIRRTPNLATLALMCFVFSTNQPKSTAGRARIWLGVCQIQGPEFCTLRQFKLFFLMPARSTPKPTHTQYLRYKSDKPVGGLASHANAPSRQTASPRVPQDQLSYFPYT